MKTDTENLIAAGCGVLYLLAFLFLPFVAIKLIGIGVNGADTISISGWAVLPLVAGIVMIVAPLVLDSKIAMIVDIVGAFLPLIVYFIILDTVVGGGLEMLGLAKQLGGLATGAISKALTVGLGVFLDILLGLGGAFVCVLAGQAGGGRSRRRTNVPSSDDMNW